MNTMSDVAEFHKAFGLVVPEEPGLSGLSDNMKLRLRMYHLQLKYLADLIHKDAGCCGEDITILTRMQLMVEELAEVAEAIMNDDIHAVLHELTDLNYVVNGALLDFGLREYVAGAHNEVHQANMSKLGPNGKVVKPHDFKKADMKRIMP